MRPDPGRQGGQGVRHLAGGQQRRQRGRPQRIVAAAPAEPALQAHVQHGGRVARALAKAGTGGGPPVLEGPGRHVAAGAAEPPVGRQPCVVEQPAAESHGGRPACQRVGGIGRQRRRPGTEAGDGVALFGAPVQQPRWPGLGLHPDRRPGEHQGRHDPADRATREAQRSITDCASRCSTPSSRTSSCSSQRPGMCQTRPWARHSAPSRSSSTR